MRRETIHLSGFLEVLVAGLIVGGCADLAATDSAQPPPTLPDKKKLAELVASAFQTTKLSGTVEVSPLRVATHGPGEWMFCMKSNAANELAKYAVYLRNNAIAEIRSGVFIDGCYKDTYGPLPAP
jgi:hypothetical protein